MKTRWTDKVDRNNPLPEYPRPQMERSDWMSLNGVYDYEILPAKDILDMEPTLNPEILGGIYSPRDRQANQFILVSAMAENAAENGVEFVLDCAVTGMDVKDGKIHAVHTTKGDFQATWVINAAGLYCDEISAMVDECDFKINPRKGEFYVFSHDTPVKVSHIISSVPSPKTRGVLVIPTVDNNMLVGPTADDVEDKTDVKTTAEGLASIKSQALNMIPGLHFEDTITQFVGVRPARTPEGYDIRFSEKVKGFVGNFDVTIKKNARYVKEDICTGCGACVEKCPMKKVPNEFNLGMDNRSAIYIPFAQAVPKVATIDPNSCNMIKNGKCGLCARVCAAGAIDYTQKD